MWVYPVNAIEDSNREILVDFPDIPWCHSTGDDESGALLNETALAALGRRLVVGIAA